MPENLDIEHIGQSNDASSRRTSVTLNSQAAEHALDIDAEKSITAAEDESTKKKKSIFVTFLGLQIALFLAALDGTIVSTALPRIGSDFNDSGIVAWVATAYILTFDAFQPLFSKFSDIFGRKWILVFGVVVFLLGSLLCAVAKNMIWLIVCRAIAGIGGAGIFSMVFIIIADLVPLEKRGSYQGVINSVFALSSVFGPLIGGSFTDYVTWRWNFYINLPIGAVALGVILFCLHLPIPTGSLKEKLKRIDYIGTFTVLAFATLFLLAMNFGGQTFPWKSAAVIVPLILTGLLIGFLVFIETKVVEPLMPPRLFKNRSIVAVLATNWFFGITFFSLVYYLPVYFQVVRGDSAMWSGIRLIPMQMLIAVFSTAAGIFISKVGIYKPLLPLGMGLLTLCTGLVSLFDEYTDYSKIYGYTVIGGAGLGFMFSSAIIALHASCEPRDIAVVTGLGNFSRILGGALGVAISSAILNSSLTKDLPLIVPDDIAKTIISSSEYVRNGLPPQYLEAVIHCYVNALKLIWYVMIGMCGFGFCLSLLVKSGTVFKNGHGAKPNESQKDEEVVVDTHADHVREDTVATNIQLGKLETDTPVSREEK